MNFKYIEYLNCTLFSGKPEKRLAFSSLEEEKGTLFSGKPEKRLAFSSLEEEKGTLFSGKPEKRLAFSSLEEEKGTLFSGKPEKRLAFSSLEKKRVQTTITTVSNNMTYYLRRIYNNICYYLDHPDLHIHCVSDAGDYRPKNVDQTISSVYDSIFDIDLATQKNMIMQVLENMINNNSDRTGYHILKRYYTDLDYSYSIILKCMNYLKNQSYVGSINNILFSTRFGENIININININHKNINNNNNDRFNNYNENSGIYIMI